MPLTCNARFKLSEPPNKEPAGQNRGKLKCLS
nr:MAG TPA: hypothetical protein [Caudoviricetes sp.]